MRSALASLLLATTAAAQLAPRYTLTRVNLRLQAFQLAPTRVSNLLRETP
jgi:hypothetical protein